MIQRWNSLSDGSRADGPGRVMAELDERLRSIGQDHLLRFETELPAAERAKLREQISAINFERVAAWYEESKHPAAAIEHAAIAPIHAVWLPRTPEEFSAQKKARELGLEALKAGRTAVVLVAGGQGSRLGFEKPKGMYPLGPVAGSSLFQIFAESIRARREQSGRSIPWYIMTSDATHAETVQYFEDNAHFGLPADDVKFFRQGTMPAVDLKTGKALLAEKGRVSLSPNGHGGTLLAMRDEGVLADMKRRGADLVYYFQVDNPFAKILDPEFLGYHLRDGADISVKAVRKRHPAEKVGLVVKYKDRASIIEYIDLPTDLGELRDDAQDLIYWAGNTAIHVFGLEFLERVAANVTELPIHFAKKAVPYVDDQGRLQTPKEPNALKFEMFIFDCLPLAKEVTVVETARADEFEPVKNATGDHSPAVVRAAMTHRAGEWLSAAKAPFPKNDNGEPSIPLEISPLCGLTPEEFAGRLKSPISITRPTYLTRQTGSAGELSDEIIAIEFDV